MDPITIGKKIKEIYPQYSSVDDSIIGTKYLNKYGGAISSITSKQLKLTDLPASQQVGVGVGLGAIGFKPAGEGTELKQDALDIIDRLKQENTKPITGTFQIGAAVPGSKAQKAVALYDQLLAKLSIEGRSLLKGSGQVSDYETKLLERSVASLRRNMSDADFKAELERMGSILNGKVNAPSDFTDSPQRDSAVQKLKANGYLPQEIDQYIKQKGL